MYSMNKLGFIAQLAPLSVGQGYGLAVNSPIRKPLDFTAGGAFTNTFRLTHCNVGGKAIALPYGNIGW